MSHCDIEDKSEPSLDGDGRCACVVCRERRTITAIPHTIPPGSNYQLFEHMVNEHALTLLDSELEDIIAVCGRIIEARESNKAKEEE